MRPEYDSFDSRYDSAPPPPRPPRLWPGLTSLILGLVGVGFEAFAVIMGFVWDAQVRGMQQGGAMVFTGVVLITILVLIGIAGHAGLAAVGFGIGGIAGSRGRGRRLGIYGVALGLLALLPNLILVVVLKVGEHMRW